MRESGGRTQASRDALLAFVVLGSVFLALTIMSWRKWPDLVIDFGVQLYVPWKISMGAVLYRDVPYLTGGPLSQYFDGLIFRVFGASVLTLVLINLALLAALVALVYRAFYRAAGQATALMAGLAILLAFAFGQYSEHGVFNYVTPYSEEIYQGLVLSVLTIALLSQWVRTRGLWSAALAGFVGGLVFLTKAEVFLALAAAFAATFVAARCAGHGWAGIGRGAGLMLAGAIIPCLGFLLYFWLEADLGRAAGWTCWAWTPILTTRASDSPFYRWCLGLDAPGFYVKHILIDFAALAAVVFLSASVLRRWKKKNRETVAWAVLAVTLGALAWEINWVECGLCLPLVCAVAIVLLFRRLTPEAVFPFVWSVFSLVLLAKLGFYPRIWHYGFILGMPAFLTAVFLLLKLLPDVLEERGVSYHLLRSLFGIVLGVGLAQLVLDSKFIYQKKTVAVGTGADLIWTFPAPEQPEGASLALAYSWLQTNTPAKATLAVLPQGVMLNFLLRRDNPARYLRWNPPEIAAFGQTNMIRVFEEHPPDNIVLLGLDNSEFGVRYFGDSAAFGQDLMRFVARRYDLKCQIGEDWSKTGRFGLKILQRNSQP